MWVSFFFVLFCLMSNSSVSVFGVSEDTNLSDPTEPPFINTVNSSCPLQRLPQDSWSWINLCTPISLSLSVCLSLFLASLAPPSALARPKPYQGVRVRDPVKELLRRKRSLELHSTKTAPPPGVRTAWHVTLTCIYIMHFGWFIHLYFCFVTPKMRCI